MAALRYRLTRDLRRRWRPLLAIALLLGVAGGVALAAAAGARRTASAYDRFLERSNASDILVNPANGDHSRITPAMIEALPMVEQAAFAPFLMVTPTTIRSAADLSHSPLAAASVGGVLGYQVDQPNLLAGRLPNPARADEIYLNQQAADALGLRVGDRLHATTASFDEIMGSADPAAAVREGTVGTPVSFVVTGIGVSSDEIVVDEGYEFPMSLLTPAYYREHATERAGFWGSFVKLRHGSADVPAFRSAVQKIADRYGEGVEFKTTAATARAVRRAIDPQAVALALFALIVALAGVVLGAQALARRMFLDAADHPALRALGVTGGELFVSSMADVFLAAMVGLIVMFALAWGVSGQFPVGPAALAEPDPGLQADPTAFVLAAVVMLMLIPMLMVWPAWRLARNHVRERPTRPSRVAALFARAGSPPPLLTGVRHAFERGRGRSAVPVVTTMVSAVGAIAVVVAALTFASSLDHLATTPRLYGWNWDRVLQFDASPEGSVSAADDARAQAAGFAAVADALDASGDVAGWSYFEAAPITLDGHAVPGVGVERGRGDVVPTVVRGAEPLTDTEVALGQHTMDQLGVGIGDTVRSTADGTEVQLRVVGQVVLPTLGQYPGQDKTTIGDGAIVTRTTLHRLASSTQTPAAVIRFGRRAGAVAHVQAVATSALVKGLSSVSTDLASGATVHAATVRRPSDVSNYERVRGTPLVLAAVLALLAGAAVAHGLVTSIRTRRRSLAILRCEGFTRRQVFTTVAVHATTIAVVAVLVGIPLGVALGRVAWNALATSIGAVADPVVPIALLLLVPCVLVIANAVAVLPARRAARIAPALALRSE